MFVPKCYQNSRRNLYILSKTVRRFDIGVVRTLLPLGLCANEANLGKGSKTVLEASAARAGVPRLEL
jgi:hypothetical protein